MTDRVKSFITTYWELIGFALTVAFFAGAAWLKATAAYDIGNEAKQESGHTAQIVARIDERSAYLVESVKRIENSLNGSRHK